MSTELVSIPTDSLALDGLLYRPDSGPIKGAVMLMHGNMSNFYTGPSRFLVPHLVEAGFAVLAFNRRGHDILINPVGRGKAGGAFQTAEEGMADNEVAGAFLAEQVPGVPRFVVGHSNGGMLGVQYAKRHPELSGLVLMSAHAGGPDTYWRSSKSGSMAGDRAQELHDLAKEMVADGRGGDLLLMPNWWYAISATSLLDRAYDTPDTLLAAPEVTVPSLTIRGSLESAELYPMDKFTELTAGPSKFVTMDGGDHFYTGCEDEVSKLIAGWLTTAVG